MFSAEEIENADAPALRVMVDKLSVALNVANSAAAHHRLQYKLLFMESTEATKRMEVELEMTQREVEVLQQSSSAHLREPLEPLLITTPSSRPLDSSPTPATEDLLTTLRAHCRRVEHDNDLLQQRLREARTLILERESSFVEEAERLRQRIAENRQHMYLFRRSTSTEMPPISTASLPIPPLTPVRQRLTTTEPASGKYSKKSRTTEEPFAALLLAGSVLSQGPSSSTPQTPSRPPHKTSKQQYAAIPQTPLHARSTHADPYYASSARRARLASPNQHDATPTPNLGTLRRRQSRDSTISAEDDDDEAAHAQTPLRSRERAVSVPRQRMPGTPTPTPGSIPKPQTLSQSALAFGTGGVQSRLYGPVGKPSAPSAEKQKQNRGADDGESQISLTTIDTNPTTNSDAPPTTKRKSSDTTNPDTNEDHEAKKPRTEDQNTKAPLVEGVGLGIGGLA